MYYSFEEFVFMKYTRSQWIGIVAALIVAIIIFFPFFNKIFFSTSSNPIDQITMTEQSQKQSSHNEALAIADNVIGSGDVAVSGSLVTVHYTGTLEDGTVFDSSVSRGAPFQFPLGYGRVIKGWDEGVVGMKVGGKRTLVIKPAYAYGDAGVQNPQTGEYIS